MPITKSEIESTGERWVYLPPATTEEIDAAERELELVIPKDMRELLRISNGLKLPHPNIEDPTEGAKLGFEILFGLERQILETGHFRLHWIGESAPRALAYAEQAKQFLIVAEDGSGNYIAYSPVGREDGSWGLGLLEHETREFEPWEDFELLDLLTELHW